jgi:hypothetical protein
MINDAEEEEYDFLAVIFLETAKIYSFSFPILQQITE